MSGLACHECGCRVDHRRPGPSRQVIGWMQNRSAGGANQVIGPVDTGLWLCRDCTEGHKSRATTPGRGQRGLFG